MPANSMMHPAVPLTNSGCLQPSADMVSDDGPCWRRNRWPRRFLGIAYKVEVGDYSMPAQTHALEDKLPDASKDPAAQASPNSRPLQRAPYSVALAWPPALVAALLALGLSCAHADTVHDASQPTQWNK